MASLTKLQPGAKIPAAATNRSGLAARLRPHELIAMLTHHYTRVRARSLPKVKTTINVLTPAGRHAVTLGWE